MARTLPALSLILLLFATGTGSAGERPPPAGPTVLTVSGAVTQFNRGPVDRFRDGFFVYQDKSFKRAFALDLDMLKDLKQVEVSARAAEWPAPVRIKGPLLRDVLDLAGATGSTVTLYALDGYAAELTRADLDAETWVLGIVADGRPLGLGGKGPVWLAYDTSGRSDLPADAETKWVWSLFHIDVAEPAD